MHLPFLPQFFVSYSILNLWREAIRNNFFFRLFFEDFRLTWIFLFFYLHGNFLKLERDENQFRFDLFIVGKTQSPATWHDSLSQIHNKTTRDNCLWKERSDNEEINKRASFMVCIALIYLCKFKWKNLLVIGVYIVLAQNAIGKYAKNMPTSWVKIERKWNGKDLQTLKENICWNFNLNDCNLKLKYIQFNKSKNSSNFLFL